MGKIQDILRKNGLGATDANGGTTGTETKTANISNPPAAAAAAAGSPAQGDPPAPAPGEAANISTPGDEGAAPPAAASPAGDPEGSAQGAASPAAAPAAEMDEALLLAELKRRGIEVANLSDLKPAPEAPSEEAVRAAEEKRQADIRAYALKEGKVKAAELDAYAHETAIPKKELALGLFKGERVAELKKAGTPRDQWPTDEEIEEEFDELHFQHLQETDPRRLYAERRLEKGVDAYLADTYGHITKLGDDYDRHRERTEAETAYAQRVEAAARAIGDTLTFEIPDEQDVKRSYKFKLTPDILREVTDTFKATSLYQSFGKEDPAKLTEAMRATIQQKQLVKIIQEIAAAHFAARKEEIQRGRRNIPTDGGTGTGKETGEKVSRGVRTLIDKNKHLLQN